MVTTIIAESSFIVFKIIMYQQIYLIFLFSNSIDFKSLFESYIVIIKESAFWYHQPISFQFTREK